MSLRSLVGEIKGSELINIGDIVTVRLGDGGEIFGRLNSSTPKQIKVGMIFIKVERIIDINKFKK